MPMYDDDMQTGTRVRSAPGDSSRVLKSGDFENRDGWNTVEVIIQGDRSTHLVNGRIVNSAHDIQQPDPNKPLSDDPADERTDSPGSRGL